MDILSYITILRNFNSDDLLPDLRALNHDVTEVSPTRFMSEMQLSTEQRHQQLIKLFYRKKTGNKGTIDIVPPMIIFQNYQEGVPCTVPLSVINTGKTSCYMKLLFQHSPYFSVIHDDKLIPAKLAPGMEINFLVQFIAEEKKDYWHQVKIFTDNEEYTVSLIAIGPRPLLNLPDDISLADCPVKIESTKHIIVKNTAPVPAVFNIHVKPPFSVSPLKGILESNETAQFVVKFQSSDEGNYNETITVNYESGERLVIGVQASAICTNIYLNKRKVQFEDTYRGLQCHKLVQLVNKSNHIVHFAWKTFNSNDLDQKAADKIKESFNTIRDQEAKKCTKLQTYDVIDRETSELIYDRIYKDEIAEFNKSEQFLFYHPEFSIIPQTGDIGANHSTDITVMFSPNYVRAFETMAYCDVTGRVERLPLKLMGVGIGPKFTLNLDSLDMNNVFLYTDHCFEVVVCNDGDIPGKLSYVPREYDFGIHISCEPSTLFLKPFEHGAFDLHFHCTNEGSFIEEIHFCVEHSEAIIKLLINGKVLYPLLTVNINQVNFGCISLGYSVTKPIALFNNTPIEIPFDAYVYPDGSDRASILHHTTYVGKVDPVSNPKEFEINPSSGIVPPNSSLILQLTLVANICRVHITTLFIETWNTTKHRLTFELKHNGRIPELFSTPSDINIRFCFLDYLCHRLIVIKNKSSFIGCMHLYAEEQDGLTVLTPVTEFCIEPYGIIEVSLDIICRKLGVQSTVLKLHLFGGQPMVICTITCTGQGPVLSIIPEHLHLGQVKLLEDTCKTVCIYNDSPIGAAVTLQVNENGPWKIDPTEAFLEPEESRDITVSVYLNNTKKYNGSILIDVWNRGIIECKLTATGVGTCIQVTPSITPVLDLGAQLTKHAIRKQLVFTNKGVRDHKILIACSREIRSFQQYNADDYPTLFSFVPHFFSLAPDESITVTLNGQNSKIQRVEETFYCHALIDNKEKKQIIIETTVIANFVEPVLTFSKKEMSFRVDFNVDTIRNDLTDVLEIKNNTSLVLEVDFQMQPPFFIELNGVYVVHHFLEMQIDETCYLTIFFDSSTENNRCLVVTKTLEITYRGHPHKDHINLRGEVNYPNIQFVPELVDFGAVTANAQSQMMIELKNTSPLPISYHFEWLEDGIFMSNVPPIDKLPVLELQETLTDYSVSSQASEEILPIHEHLPAAVSAKSTKKQHKAKEKHEKPTKTSKKPRSQSQIRKSKNCLPVEIIFQQYATETNKYPDQVQIYQELHAATSTTRLVVLPEWNRDNLMQLKQMLYPFVDEPDVTIPSATILQCLSTTAPSVAEISRIIEIVPSRGHLEPFETQLLSLSYRPTVNTSVKARVLCHVLGGPTEQLDITGMASDISYYLNKTSIDFGRQVFCEVSQKNIKLINTGYIPFTFTTTAKPLPTEAQTARLLEVGWFTVQPQSATVHAQSEMELLVRYYPGIAGKFAESFLLEIGHLTPVTVTVTGYGVFAQVHLNLPRPSMCKVPMCTCYTAIANITPDYLVFVENIKVWTHPEGEVHVSDLSKEEKRQLQKDGWVVISYSNTYPSAMDIDLAVERMLAYEYITQHPEILTGHSLSTSLKSIPRFYTPAYLIDFGYVITDTLVHYTVLILNYGSASCKVRVVPNLRKSGFLRAGFNIQHKGAHIPVGDTEALYVIFCPTSELYPTRRQSVKYRIAVEVEHGPRIPITVQATVTVPFIVTSTNRLEFGRVTCGQRKMMNFFISNTGYVRCTWEACIEKIPPIKLKKCKDQKICTFYLDTDVGQLEPGDKMLLDVYFEPHRSDQFEWKLTITLDQNPEEFVVLLNGAGVVPWLKINEQTLQFVPALPYSNESVQSFTVENPCAFPIEFYLCEFDEQILEEETIIRLLNQYYSSDTLYIPQRIAGDKLPAALYSFHEDLLNELRGSLTDKDETHSQATNLTARTKKVKKRKASSGISSLDSKDRHKTIKRQSMSLTKKPKILPPINQNVHTVTVFTKFTQGCTFPFAGYLSRHTHRPNFSLNPALGILAVMTIMKQFAGHLIVLCRSFELRIDKPYMCFETRRNIRTGYDPLENKTPDEIETMLTDLLANKCNSDNTGSVNLMQDPIETSFKQLAPAPVEMDPCNMKEGILIVFHGAPYTESVYAANRTAKKLNLPVSNITHLILEALAYNETASCTRINEIIGNAYNQATDAEAADVETEDPDLYKKLECKIHYLTSCDVKRKRQSAKGSAKSSKSGKSDATGDSRKTKGQPGVDAADTLLNIPQELLIDVLREQLQQYKLGIVIESLNNIFIRTPILALMSLLKAVGNLKYIHCFLIYNSMQAYQSIISDKREAERNKQEQEKIEMLEHFDAITEEEFENLPVEYLDLYKNTYVAKRKDDRQQRLDAIRMKRPPTELTQVFDNKKRRKTELDTNISVSTEKGKKDKLSAKKSDKSSVSSKKTKKTVKLSSEMQKVSKEFDSFIAEYRHMLHILEFWDRKASILTKEYTEQVSKRTEKSAKKNKKDSKSLSAVMANVIEIETVIGVPFWILNTSASNESQMLDMISSVMHDYVEYRNARRTVYQSLIVTMEPSVAIHSILKQPVNNRSRILSEVFTITTSDNISSEIELGEANMDTISDNTETNIVENADRKSITTAQDHNTASINVESNSRLRKSKVKKRISLNSKQDLSPTEPAQLKVRVVLQPGDKIKYRVRFAPKTIGCYQHTYSVEMVGWYTVYSINCQAHCDIPKIDMNPKTMFANVVKEKNPQNEYRRNMFVKTTGTFEFGNSFLCNHHGKHWDRPRKNKTTIAIRNISLVSCEITTHLLEETGVFQQTDHQLIVQPQRVHNLALSACPALLGPNRNTLALSLKHNPRIEVVPLNCIGCKIEFEILNRKITFERVLLGHKEQQIITLINYSMVPIHWAFTNVEMFTNQFHIVPQHGDIRENDCIDISIDYNATEVDVMPMRKLFINIFEENDQDEPLLTEMIEISAETRDILVDCIKNIDFGEVKAKKNHTLKYDFMNNGKYNIIFEISELSAEEVDKSTLAIMKMFKISHLNGVLVPGKVFNTIITFNSLKMIDIADYPIFKCSLMDHINRNVLSTFYITATAKTYYSLFEVYPSIDVNFGAMLVGTYSSQTLTITNVGRFPFDYSVLCKRRMSTVTMKDPGKKQKKATKGDSSARRSEGSLKSKKSAKSAESKRSGSLKSAGKKSGKPSKVSIVSKKIKGMVDSLKKKEVRLGPPISCGTFEIKNARGTIKPGGAAELEVECNIMDVGAKEEKIIILVSEAAPKDTDGRIVSLAAIGCTPSVDFKDYANIYGEHFIVQREVDFAKHKELENHCVFIIDDQQLVFNNVCINTTCSAQLQLYNNSLVEAELSLKSTLPSVYKVDPVKLYIPSYTHGQLTVTFNPIAIEAYKANLELLLVMPDGYKPEVQIVHLFGEGRVPEITLIQPASMDRNNNYMLLYEPTLVGKQTVKVIRLVNSADFPCKVICEICDDPDGVFYINVASSEPAHTGIVKLIPDELEDIIIIYQPAKVALNKCKIKLHIVNNPFEVIQIKVTATSYSEDVVLENIPTCTPIDNSRMSSVSLINDINNTSYLLNFANVNMNSLQTKKFKILNRSTSDIYKFAFKSAAVQEVSFIPAVGHLRPEAYKEIIVTFLTDSPVTYDKIVMECVVSKIQYRESVDNVVSWDERQKLLIGNDDNEVLLDESTEPQYTVLDGHVKKIPVLLSAQADYATYECNVCDVLFKDTMMFEKRTYTFTMFNTGSVNLEISWNILLANTIRPTSAVARKISRENITSRRPETARSSGRLSKQELKRVRALTGQEHLIEQCKSTFSLTSSTTCSTNSDSCHVPFTITPEHVVIPARQSHPMTVTFAPLDVDEYRARLRGHVTNLSPEHKHIDVGLAANSLMPYCYFDVRLSDYISSGRRTVDKCSDVLDLDTKVVEFDCLGVGHAHEKSFNITNPTDDDLIFSWEQLKSSEIASSVPLFSCIHSTGSITRGKMVKTTFTILPQTTGTFEALYNFKLETHNFMTTFLLVANIRDPKVYFLRPHLTMKPTVIGISVCDYITLKNDEQLDLNFKFPKSSLFSASRKELLAIEPRHGTALKQNETQIKISFNPTDVGDESFMLKCNVNLCKVPLTVSVNTVCYKLEPVVSYMVTSGKRIALNSDNENVINLGTLSPNRTETITFNIKNIGRTGFYYLWKLNTESVEKKLHLSVTDKEGYVKKDTEINTLLKLTSNSSVALKNHHIEFKVKYGPKYKIFLNGSSTTVLYKFSFLHHDFGACLIQNSNVCYNHKTLEFFNNSLTPITLENTFNNTEYLSIDFEARQIMAKARQAIEICFHPRQCEQHREDLVFLVNCQPVKVTLHGTGVEMNICLVNAEDKCIDMGTPEIGELVTRTVQVFNRSATQVEAHVDLCARLPIVTGPVTVVTHYLKIPTKTRIIQDEIEEKIKADDKKGKRIERGSKVNKKSAGSIKSDKSRKKSNISAKTKEKSKKSEKSSKNSKKTVKETEFIDITAETQAVEGTERQLLTSMITITPKCPLKIGPNKMAEFSINYLPTKRLETFSEKISVQVHETVTALCVIRGRSLAADFRLDRCTISFGIAVLHCYRESKLTLINDGDIGSRFSWQYASTREFSITPMLGYSTAGSVTVFNIMFCPTQIGVQSKLRMECDLKDVKKILYLELIGTCCDLPAPLDCINFRCPVRTDDRRTLIIQNGSGQDWNLTPIISGDYFTTNTDIVQVPAKSSTTCDIIYKPLLMTSKDPHTGSIFFKIPDGKAILYNFEGNSDRPVPIKSVTLTVPCKTRHTELLTVGNWSRDKQQFKVYTEDITQGDVVNLYEINGQDFIDILGNDERDYSWLFYAYKECSLEFRVIFMNEMKEYMYYKLTITVTKCKPLETVTLITCARTPVTHELTLINPLTDPIVYKLTSTSPTLTFKTPVTVHPYSEISTVIEYNPLLVEDSKVILEAACTELGAYPYEFKLWAYEAVPERELKFTTVLGDVQVLIASVKNLTKSKTSFVCKVDDENSFTVDKLLTISANQTSNVPVTFTPYKLGNIEANLTISSPTAGDFVFPLLGTCQSPKPKGPLNFKPDTSVVIDFHNPFLTDLTFSLNAKPNIFTVKATEEMIKSKANAKIVVKMADKIGKLNSTVSGKLVITPKNKSLGDIKWIYYLQECIN